MLPELTRDALLSAAYSRMDAACAALLRSIVLPAIAAHCISPARARRCEGPGKKWLSYSRSVNAPVFWQQKPVLGGDPFVG